MNARHRILTLGLVGALALTACGGDDDADAGTSDGTVAPATTAAGDDATEPTDAGGAATSVASTDASGDPVPTIAPDVPEEFVDGVGPLAVVGEGLPRYPETEAVDPAVGMAVPVIIGETLDGEPVRIDPAVDGPTWIVFLAHWCSHCNAEIPVINQLRDEGRIPEGVDVVAVSTAYNPGRPNWPPDEWLDEMDWTFPAVNDGIDMVAEAYIAASAFGIGGFPFSVLVDGDGIVTTRWSGERGIDELESLLVDNLTG